MTSVIDLHPPTPAQLGLLYHVASEPADHPFLERIVCPLTGPLDVDTFTRVWRTLVARHASLRSAFTWDGSDGPRQVVHRDAALNVRVVDWTSTPVESRAPLLDDALAREAAAGFDLKAPPLTRLTLARLDAEEHLLIWSSHHLIVDGWSCWLLLAEAALLYLSDLHGVGMELPGAARFGDYARWLYAQDLAPHRKYWCEYLTGVHHGAPAERSRAGGRRNHHYRARLNADVSEALTREARNLRVGLNTLLQAAWALTLSERRGVSDGEVVFGTVCSGRSAGFPDAAHVVGMLSTVLPVRVPLREDLTTREWLDLLRRRHVEMLCHEGCTTHQVQRWAGLDLDRPLFDSVLVLMNVDPLDRLPDLGFRIGRPQYFASPSHPLGVNVTPGAEFAIDFLYDERYFTAAAILETSWLLSDALSVLVESAAARVADVRARLRRRSRERVATRRGAAVGLIGRHASVSGVRQGVERLNVEATR